jgi:hypothetical protein
VVESRLHEFLKKIGEAFLLNQGCFLVDTEVPLTRYGQRRLHALDERHVIDVCGLGERFSKLGWGAAQGDDGPNSRDYEVKRNVLRGIEVKVSRSDFRNGFVCTGCSYNYLLTPMRLVSPSEVPRGVGLIEYNRYKFAAELNEDGAFALRGVRVVRRPAFKRIRHYQVDNATSRMVCRLNVNRPKELLEGLLRGHSEIGYRHLRAGGVGDR